MDGSRQPFDEPQRGRQSPAYAFFRQARKDFLLQRAEMLCGQPDCLLRKRRSSGSRILQDDRMVPDHKRASVRQKPGSRQPARLSAAIRHPEAQQPGPGIRAPDQHRQKERVHSCSDSPVRSNRILPFPALTMNLLLFPADLKRRA